MPVKINGYLYYRTMEACQKMGISRTTFHRWVKDGVIEDPSASDRNGWRLFTEKDIAMIRAEAIRISQE